MRRVRFGNEPAGVEHERIVGAGLIGFNFGENRVEQIGVVNTGIENVRWRPAELACDQCQPTSRINRRLEFCEHDQGWPALIQARIHPGSNFQSPSKS